MTTKNKPSLEQIENHILSHIYYDDGKIYWKNKAGRWARVNNCEAGINGSDGYRRVKILQKSMLTHRVVFFLHNRYWPKALDHIDNDLLNNKIENLRPCTLSQNQMNSRNRGKKSDMPRNVVYNKDVGKYSVWISYNKRRLSLGYYEDLELAELVASEARKKYYGEWDYYYEQN